LPGKSAELRIGSMRSEAAVARLAVQCVAPALFYIDTWTL
jgi:hypothetical protein